MASINQTETVQTDFYHHNNSFTVASRNLSSVSSLANNQLGMEQIDYAHYLADKWGLTMLFCVCLTTASVGGILGNVLVSEKSSAKMTQGVSEHFLAYMPPIKGHSSHFFS